ncbi:class I SAM-dependent methyltransferase [Streptomyces sp. b94]|uniref:class I SAM-dependent DNA methyltransferase n=1 Tax=Streptomyces sp. b94 TaxID=1827634 RepID=UPI001B35E7B9|nr:class I SAM-dependent methyltransferase [Streptomyces sp. b94]MBQ1097273.1 class I SAM-dependent methyltransferase [Streptomyces sp. b94]
MYDDQFADVYDRVYCALYDYAEHAELIGDLARQHVDSPKTLLDVGCGTGEHLRYLAKQFSVTGVDLSESMVRVARRKLGDVAVHQADMRDFDLGRTFDVVCSMYSSVGYLGGPEELRAATARMAAHVAPGGVLVVEPWILREKWNGGVLAHATVEHEGTTISRMGHWRTEGDRSQVDMHYLVSEPDGVRHFVDHQKLALYSLEEYQDAFTRAGLEASLLPAGRADRGVFVAVPRTGARGG